MNKVPSVSHCLVDHCGVRFVFLFCRGFLADTFTPTFSACNGLPIEVVRGWRGGEDFVCVCVCVCVCE